MTNNYRVTGFSIDICNIHEYFIKVCNTVLTSYFIRYNYSSATDKEYHTVTYVMTLTEEDALTAKLKFDNLIFERIYDHI